MSRTATLAVMILLGAAASAGAQAKPPQPPPKPAQPTAKPTTKPKPSQPVNRVYISINGAFQTAAGDFGETVTFVENAENGTFTTDYTVESGPALNISAGAAIWRNIGVGVGVTRFSKSTPIAFSASVPHPLFFNRNRNITGDVGGLKREELAVHIQAQATFTPSPKIQGVVFGGPSFFSVKQDIVNDFEITEAYPYDTATFSQGLTTTVDESKVGFHVGADVGYFFSRQVGVGGTIQWSGTTIEVPGSGASSPSFDLKAGGFQAGGGVRFRF
jgi:opacity protein-like surface antigen